MLLGEVFLHSFVKWNGYKILDRVVNGGLIHVAKVGFAEEN